MCNQPDAKCERMPALSNNVISSAMTFDPYPKSFIFQAGPNKQITIKRNGTVELSEGMDLDEASTLFWRRIQDAGLKLSCEQK